MTRKKVVVISTYDSIDNPYYSGGGARSIHEVAKRLCQDYEVLVVTGNFPGEKRYYIDGVNYKYVGFNFLGPKIGQLYFQISILYNSLRIGFDCWIESFTPPFSTSFLPLVTKKPVIGLVHMLGASDMKKKYKIPFFIIENIGLRYYRRFIVLTELMAEKIRKSNSEAEIVTIPNGISAIKPLNNAELLYIVFLGRIDIEIKGIDMLISTYTKLYNTNNSTPSLLIIGNGLKDEIIKLRRIIASSPAKDKIILYGYANEDEKDTLLNHAYTCVIPSRSESFSLVALECMARGIPITNFSIEGLAWIPDSASLKAPKYNEAILQENINLILNDAQTRLRLKHNGIEFARTLTWDKIGLVYNNYISSVLGN